MLLQVSFIQMLKAFTPVAVLLISFAARIKEPSQKLFIIVGTISLGVAIASYGEIEFELIGFLVQVSPPSHFVRMSGWLIPRSIDPRYCDRSQSTRVDSDLP